MPKIVRFFRLIYWTNSMLSRTKKHTQNKSDKTFCLTFFLSHMVRRSYLIQNLEVSREFRDVPRKKKKL